MIYFLHIVLFFYVKQSNYKHTIEAYDNTINIILSEKSVPTLIHIQNFKHALVSILNYLTFK